MAILPIVKYPDPRLRQPTVPVERVDDAIKTLVRDMIDTMYASNGAGLAAIQVGSDKRIFVIEGQVAGLPDGSPALVCINPEIAWLGDELDGGDEGCLSFPGIFVPVKRSLRARVRAMGLDGKTYEAEGEGLFARAIQHEQDHLTGRLLIDMVGALKREMIKRKLKRAAERGDDVDEAAEAEG